VAIFCLRDRVEGECLSHLLTDETYEPLHPVTASPAGAAVLALGLYGVLQAVDGVALKHAVDAWMAAPDGERAARFASAEAVRWLEWGVRSYHTFMLGVSLFLFAGLMVRAGGVPRPIGYLVGLSGLAYVAQGWVLGVQGFSAANGALIVAGIVLVFIWSVCLLWTGRREH